MINFICFCLFVGAMGKSAQIPLHVWLPESMEGPTPISALIHAATMVTAGIFMIVRMSPLFEFAPLILNIIMFIGSTGALLLGAVGLVQNDIKRVVAYSTLSQLGYMIAATGASAYSAAMFHLVTHAFFKALLFLGAGSVIVALHHEQDMRKMGGLFRYMPITAITCIIGSLALTAIPPFAGFYSKDAIIEAVSLSNLTVAPWASFCLVSGAFITSLYTFRALFMTFFGDYHYQHGKVKDPSLTITLPLVILAIGSVVSGFILASPILQPQNGLLSSSIYLSKTAFLHAEEVASSYMSNIDLIIQSWYHLPFRLTILGFVFAVYAYLYKPETPAYIAKKLSLIYKVLVEKLGFDYFNEVVIVRFTLMLSNAFFKFGDKLIIDDTIVNGSASASLSASKLLSKLQTGYLYHYAFAMIIGLAVLIIWLL